MEKKEYFKKLMREKQKITYDCKCGHRVTIPAFLNRRICSWCGNWVYKNQKDKFKENLRKEFKKNAKNKN